MSGLPGTPTTAATRPPALAGPRLRNFRFWNASGGWPVSSAARSGADCRAANRNIETNRALPDFFTCVLPGFRLCRKADVIRRGWIIPLLSPGRVLEVPYPGTLEVQPQLEGGGIGMQAVMGIGSTQRQPRGDVEERGHARFI